MRPIALLLTLLPVCFGCGSDAKTGEVAAAPVKAVGKKPSGDGRPKLWLSAAPGEGSKLFLTVNFEAPEGGTSPRVADIRIAHPESLKVVSSKAGDAAVAADKELRALELQPDLLRLILLSRTASHFVSGELVKLELERTDKAPIKVDIVMNQPVFAPAESMQGLTIGDPLQL